TYPYGLESTIVTEEMVKKGLANKVVVLVGGDDNNRGDHDLTKNERTDAQGHHRVERAKTFFDKSRDLAAAWGTPFNWELYVVPGIGHTQGPIAGPVAAYIFNTKLLK